MVIIEGPAIPTDTAGWERAIATLRGYEGEMEPDEYAAYMELFQSWRIASLEPAPVIAPGTIRERLARLKSERLARCG